MNLEYNWGKEELVDDLKNKRKKFNIITFIISIIIYLLFISSGIKSSLFDNKWIFIIGLIYITIVLIVLLLSTKLYIYINIRKNKNNFGKYNISLNNEYISVKYNSNEIKYNLEDVKLKIKKDYFKVYTTDDKIGLTFRKKILKDDYDTILKKMSR